MNEGKARRWQRRSAARPSEIADAALVEFAEHGFAGARLTDIAARAGVSKAALYLYYPTKTDLFRAILTERAKPALAPAQVATGVADQSFADALERVMRAVVAAIEQPELRRLARMVVGESGNFPQLASLWRENVVGPAVDALTALVARGQDEGEVAAGDPRLVAFSIMGPLLLGVIWREVVEPAGGAPLDFAALAEQHRRILLAGLDPKK